MSRLISFIILQTLIPLLLLSACNDPHEKNFEYVSDMVDPVSYQAYSENPLTPDKKTMLSPVSGSIALGKMPYPYTQSAEDANKAATELQDPYPVTEQTLARGKEVYEHVCLVCHGTEGAGNGPVIGKFPFAFNLKLSKLAPGGVYHVITLGRGLMAPYALQVTEEDRWYLVSYVMKLREGN